MPLRVGLFATSPRFAVGFPLLSLTQLQSAIMIKHNELTSTEIRSKIRKHEILFGGNRKLKIYGLLSCKSGKKMKKENRVFFATEEEAVKNNYRPCGHCMKIAYKNWKNGLI